MPEKLVLIIEAKLFLWLLGKVTPKSSEIEGGEKKFTITWLKATRGETHYGCFLIILKTQCLQSGSAHPISQLSK